MEKEFVPYELALRMKALGFDGPCFAYFLNSILQYPAWEKDYSYFNEMSDINSNFKNYEYVLVPTWQSAFKWFREKYDVHHVIHQFNFKKDTNEEYLAEVGQTDDGFMYFRTYEECECFCLTKLIEIVESKSELK